MKNVTPLVSAVALAVTVLSPPLAAQDEGGAHSIPKGTWSASCVAFNQPAICETRWSTGLNDQSMTVQSYRINHAETGTLLFEGRGVYRVRGETVDGYWEDSSDSIHRISGSWKNNILNVHWGALSDGGRSQYDFSSDGLNVTDWVLQPSGWLQFMTVEYGRAQVD